MSETLKVDCAVTPLADMIGILATVNSEPDILAALMTYLNHLGPSSAKLIFLQLDPQGQPRQSQVVAEWQDGKVLAESPEYTRNYALDEYPIASRWRAHPSTPLLLSDLDQEARNDATLRVCMAHGEQMAMAILPLYCECYGGWQGLLTLAWTAPHEFSATEQSTYRLLMALLSIHIGGLRSQKQQHAVLNEMETSYQVTRQLNLAPTLKDALHTLLLIAPSPEMADVSLGAIETDGDGAPTWFTIDSSLAAPGYPELAQVGARWFLPAFPFAKLYLSSPDAPLLIEDVENDPRVDDSVRGIYAAGGIKSAILMALTLRGKWVGLLCINWRKKVTLGDRERRLYQAVAKQAALLLDNALHVKRLHVSLKETQEQSAMLRTVIEHTPAGILFTEAPSGKVLLMNGAAERLIGEELNLDVSKGEYGASSIVYPGTDRPILTEDIAGVRAMATGKFQSEEVDVILSDRRRLSLEVVAAPMLDESGNVKNVVLVLTDVTVRKRTEQERLRLQEEIITVQAAALAERSTPLIPITDDILVLPLIGSLDTERGQQVLDVLLNGVSESRARVSIIDITGVKTLDTQAASAITNAAQALRLLGVEPVLTGIRAEVAQTMVKLGVPLSGIVTRSTLQSGIQYALRKLDKAISG